MNKKSRKNEEELYESRLSCGTGFPGKQWLEHRSPLT